MRADELTDGAGKRAASPGQNLRIVYRTYNCDATSIRRAFDARSTIYQGH